MDPKELRAKNYARIIDQNSNPFLIIHFTNYFDKDINFVTKWFDPDGMNI